MRVLSRAGFEEQVDRGKCPTRPPGGVGAMHNLVCDCYFYRSATIDQIRTCVRTAPHFEAMRQVQESRVGARRWGGRLFTRRLAPPPAAAGRAARTPPAAYVRCCRGAAAGSGWDNVLREGSNLRQKN